MNLDHTVFLFLVCCYTSAHGCCRRNGYELIGKFASDDTGHQRLCMGIHRKDRNIRHVRPQRLPASVIGPQQILTAAHCLYLKRTSHFVSLPARYTFLLGYEKVSTGRIVSSRYVTSPKFNFAKMETCRRGLGCLFTLTNLFPRTRGRCVWQP